MVQNYDEPSQVEKLRAEVKQLEKDNRTLKVQLLHVSRNLGDMVVLVCKLLGERGRL